MTRYKDLERINSGAYATLYRAYDTQLGRPVAIKFFDDPQTADFVLLQARATVAIKNDHVVTIYDTAELEHPKLLTIANAIVMELVDGESLESRLKTQVPSAAECALIAEQLLAGVGWIAENEGIHQDLHPGNILLRKSDNKVIIIDALGTYTQVLGRSRRRRITHDLRSAAEVLGDLLEAAISEAVAEQFEKHAASTSTATELKALFDRLLSGTPAEGPSVPRDKTRAFSIETTKGDRIPIGKNRETIRLTIKLVNSGVGEIRALPATMYFQPGEKSDRRWPLLDAAVTVEGVHNASEAMALRCTNYKARDIGPFSASEVIILFDRPLTEKWKNCIAVIVFIGDGETPQTFQITVEGECFSPINNFIPRHELSYTVSTSEVPTPSVAFYRIR